MAQQNIPKYKYHIVHIECAGGNADDAMERFNAAIDQIVEQGWQCDGEHQITYMHGWHKILLTQKLKKYSVAYEKYQGYHDARYAVTE